MKGSRWTTETKQTASQVPSFLAGAKVYINVISHYITGAGGLPASLQTTAWERHAQRHARTAMFRCAFVICEQRSRSFPTQVNSHGATSSSHLAVGGVESHNPNALQQQDRTSLPTHHWLTSSAISARFKLISCCCNGNHVVIWWGYLIRARQFIITIFYSTMPYCKNE